MRVKLIFIKENLIYLAIQSLANEHLSIMVELRTSKSLKDEIKYIFLFREPNFLKKIDHFKVILSSGSIIKLLFGACLVTLIRLLIIKSY